MERTKYAFNLRLKLQFKAAKKYATEKGLDFLEGIDHEWVQHPGWAKIEFKEFHAVDINGRPCWGLYEPASQKCYIPELAAEGEYSFFWKDFSISGIGNNLLRMHYTKVKLGIEND